MIGTVLKQIRESKGFALNVVAKATQNSEVELILVEDHSTWMSDQRLMSLLNFYQVTPVELHLKCIQYHVSTEEKKEMCDKLLPIIESLFLFLIEY